MNGMTASGKGTTIPHHYGEVHGNRVVSVPGQHEMHMGGGKCLHQIQDLRAKFKVEVLTLCSQKSRLILPSHVPGMLSRKLMIIPEYLYSL